MTEETVLVIEDDPSLMRGLKDNFQSRGYAVHGAVDGEMGVEAALKIRPELIILDIMLPKLNGYEVCRQLKSNPSTKHTLSICPLSSKLRSGLMK